jgi:threonine aldolase
MARHAVELSDTPDGRVRAVTHLDVSAADVEEALKVARTVLLP